MDGKIIHNRETYTDTLPHKYYTIPNHQRSVYSINEISESGEKIPLCTGVALTVVTILTAAYCMQKYEETNNYINLYVSDVKTSHKVLTSESHADYGGGFSEFSDICIVTVIFLINLLRCHCEKFYRFYSKSLISFICIKLYIFPA